MQKIPFCSGFNSSEMMSGKCHDSQVDVIIMDIKVKPRYNTPHHDILLHENFMIF